MRPVQHFSPDYLKLCRLMRPEQIVQFLDDFRMLHARPEFTPKSRLISMKVPEPLLGAFKIKARLSGIAYQTQIKRLMSHWLESADQTSA